MTATDPTRAPAVPLRAGAAAVIAGIGSALPAKLVTNADWEARLDTSDAWIVRRTGMKERHWLEPDEPLVDLALAASRGALENAGLPGGDIDHVLAVTFTPDRATPGLAPDLALKLGAHEAPAIDINAACVGFLHGLDQAAALVETGRARCVLVCAAERLSSVTNVEDRSTAILFGDGAGAAIVTASDTPVAGPPPRFVLGSDGTMGPVLGTAAEHGKLAMDGPIVFRHAVARMAGATREVLRLTGLTADDLDLFVAHQANARIIEATARELGADPAKVVDDVARIANTSATTIPLAMDQARRDGRLKPGDVVGVAAFGAGFVFGAGVLTFQAGAA